MEKSSKFSGMTSSGSYEPTSKPGITVVNHPLTPEEDAWLRQQKKRVQEVYQQLRSQEKSKTPDPADEDK